MDTTWDCIVVGAGAAGLSAALVLGRARRSTLVVDAGTPSNLPAHGIGGLLGHDGRPPAELYALGREELRAYPTVEVRTGEVVAGRAAADPGGDFTLELADGTTERTRRVLLATGMDYRRPDLPGVAERWGTSVFHCPFCHGWEHRDGRLAVMDGGPTAVHRARLLRGWSDDVVVLTDGPYPWAPDDRERLDAAHVPIDERPVAGLEGEGTALAAVVFADGTRMPRTGLLVPAPLHQRSTLAAQLGAIAAEPGPVAVDPVRVDPRFETAAPGVYAVGDLSAQLQQVARAIASGSEAAAMVVMGLLVEPAAMR